MFKLLDKLINGLIGKVIYEGDEDDEISWGEEGNVYYDGKKLYVGKELCGIDEFVFDEKDLVLIRSEGYRGECCYEGMVKKDDKWYWLDIVSEYMVYEMEED
jgi:hypothetical protein